jgi:ferrochelatase
MRARTGVVLLQLGGPETLGDVRPFLYNFFRDLIPDNLRVPRFLIPLVAWLLARWRAPHSRRLYAAIGGGSPLRAQTQLQAAALRWELRRRGLLLPVYVAMRNWKPDSAGALLRARRDGVDTLIAVPLYPQYSYSTTRSSVNELKRVMGALDYAAGLRVVEQYCEHPQYIEALVALTRRFLKSFQTPAREVHLIFSAHGLPLKYIERGDPYLEQVQRTMAAVIARLEHPGPAHLSFQSRLGPEKWLSPATETLIEKLAAEERVKALCIVPIAFVSEHVETLNEIDIQYAEVARRQGIAEFRRVCALKCHPAFIACLADEVVKRLDRARLTAADAAGSRA